MNRRRRTILVVVLALLGSAVAGVLAWIRHISAPPYRGPVSDHFDGEQFHSVEPIADKSLRDLLKWNMNRPKDKRWAWRDIEQTIPPPRLNDGLQVTWVNHATVLIQTAGLNILTDPVWSKRVSPFQWAGPARYHPPGIAFEHLPPIDVVLLSHNHWDHLDLGTLQRLARTHHPRFFVPLGNTAFLERHGVPGAVDVDWWDRHALPNDVEVISVPVQHWSTRTRKDLRMTLWCGYVIRTPRGNIYFGGDTGLGSGRVFTMARDRLGPFELAILPIGSYLPRWFMKDNHLSPSEAIEAHEQLGAKASLAMHFGTFDLGDDSQDEAAEVLRAELARRGPSAPRFLIPRPGESFRF